jgi:hypothetical protein
MSPRTLLTLLALCCAPAAVHAGDVTTPQARPAAEYLRALRVTDSFLTAWPQRDADTGLALMSRALLAAHPGDWWISGST